MGNQGFSYRIPPPPPPSSSMVYFPRSDSLDSTPEFNAVSDTQYTMAPATMTQQGIVATNASAYMMALRGVGIPPGGEKYAYKYDWRAYDGASLPNFGYTPEDTGGCEAEGRRLVTDPALAAMRQVDELAAPLLATLLASEESVAVGTSWVTCMNQRGHKYYSPLDVGPDMRDRVAVAKESQYTDVQWSTLESEEARVANDFSTCMVTSGLDAYIEGPFADEWEAFRSQHIDLLNKAGGLTGAETGVPSGGGGAVWMIGLAS